MSLEEYGEALDILQNRPEIRDFLKACSLFDSEEWRQFTIALAKWLKSLNVVQSVVTGPEMQQISGPND